jgi:hypothetical protein
VFYNTSIINIAGWRILELPVLCVLQILLLPVLMDEEYWSFKYSVFYNTSITSIVG